MYNENNRSDYEYHYCGRQPQDMEPTQPIVDLEPKSRRGRGKKILAGVLCGTLLVGASFGAGWWINEEVESRQVTETRILMSDRPAAEVSTVKVDGSKQMSYAEVYKANLASCVSINVSSTSLNFFGQVVQSASSGSGFVITEDGYIVTNYHVISGGTDVQVTMSDGTTYSAQVVGGDKDYDLAVLKVDPGETKLQAVVLGSSDDLQVGEQILAIGNPLGELTFSMSEGIVSCLNREINVDGTPFNMIQITAAVNSGNSGGPLFNTYGEVVGIVSAKFSSSNNMSGASVEGLGFAIPINDVLDMIRDIMENGQVTSHPYMGVSVVDAAYYPQSGVSAGAYIGEVVADGPAGKAGLKVGDVITMIGSNVITSSQDLKDNMGSKSYQAGDTATITFVREGKVYTTELTFGSTTEAEPTPTSQEQQMVQTPQGGYAYGGDMDDFFEEFFGGRYSN